MTDRYDQQVAPGGAGAQGPHAIATVNNYYETRPHVVEEFPQPSLPDARWLMAQPSRLLDASSQVVPFIGRETELRRLREWRDSTDTRLSVLLLHAPGGQGKTRLAAEFAEQSRGQELPVSQRWHVLQAGFRNAPTSSPSDSGTPVWDDGAGVLLVIDYADRWAHSELARLLADPVLNKQRPARVLMIGRTVRWYAAIRGELADRHAAASDLLLPPLDTDRLAMFAAARDRYCEPDLYDLPDATAIRPPGSLDDPDFGLTLTVHMAALVTIDARKRGQQPPTEPHELSAYLLDREYQAWQRLFDAGVQGQDFRTRPSIMARTVFTATLTGAVDHETGTRTVRQLNLPGHPDELLLDHRFCYPPADRRLVLEPLYPDRLAEDFLALLTPGHDISSYDPDPWATTVPGMLLLDFTALLNTAAGNILAPLTPGHDINSGDPDRRAANVPGQPAVDSTGPRLSIAARAVTFLASATERWPHVGTEVLYPLLRVQPSMAVAAGSGALTAIANIKDIPLEVLGAVEHVLPDGRNINLDIGAAAIVSALAARMFPLVDDPVDQADMHLELSDRLANAGRLAEALEHSHRGAGISERLAATDRATHLPKLARSIGTYAIDLADAGRYAEAAVHSERVVALHEELAATNRAKWLPDLAGAVNNHALRLIEVGRRAEALEFSRRAVELYEELDAADHATYRGSLAMALANHAARVGQAGFRAEAVTLSQRAVELREELAAASRARYLPDLAVSVNNHAVRLAEVGREAEALAYCERAVALREELVAANRAVYLPYLGKSLVNLATRLAEATRSGEALQCSDRAVQALEELVVANRAAHLATFATAITNHATRLAENERHGEALAWSERALHLQEELCAGNRAAHLPEWAAAVYNHAALLDRVDRHDEALAWSEQAVQLREELAVDAEGPVHQLALSDALYKHALRLGKTGRPAVAVTFSQRALALREELTDARDPARQRELATWLHNHAVWLAESGQRAESFTVSERVLALRAALADATSTAADAHVAESLTNHAIRLAESGKHAEAAVESERAVRMYEELAAAHPPTHLPGLARALTNHSNRLATAGRGDEALTCAERACELFEALVTTDRRTYLSELAVAVQNQVARLLQVGRYTDAHAPSQRSVELCQELADSHEGVHLPRLARSLRTFAAVRAKSGADLDTAALAGGQATRLYRGLSETDPAFRTELSLAADIMEDVTSKPHWQLRLGYELEEIYCAYADSQVDITRILPSSVAARTRNRGAWAAGRLREIDVDPSLIELLERALDDLPTQDNLPGKEFITAWLIRSRRMARRLEHLLQATRKAVGVRGVRYYDCGVMLCRIRVCVATIRADSPTPTEAAQARPDLVARYREELLRASEVLEVFVTHSSSARWRDPKQHDLDLRLDNLAVYLAAWRAAGANLDDSFLEQIEDVTHSAGLRISDQAEQESTRTQHRKPLANEEQTPDH